MHIMLDRDLEHGRQRYMLLTKPELINVIIHQEQYIAAQNQIWLKSQIGLFQELPLNEYGAD